MKYLVLCLLALYHFLISGIVKQVLGIPASCRYSPTCSAYMEEAIRTEGVVKGGVRGIKRLMTCHPFAKQHAAI